MFQTTKRHKFNTEMVSVWIIWFGLFRGTPPFLEPPITHRHRTNLNEEGIGILLRYLITFITMNLKVGCLKMMDLPIYPSKGGLVDQPCNIIVFFVCKHISIIHYPDYIRVYLSFLFGGP